MIVCVCNRVSDRTIVAQAQSGKSFDEIQFDLQVGLQCGNCEGCARDLVANCQCAATAGAQNQATSVALAA
jgi:bacterioferritin-associated ferredoxin